MQQSTSVQVVPSAHQTITVTVPHNQIPVAQYVSVTAGKQDLNVSDGGKQIASQPQVKVVKTVTIRGVCGSPPMKIKVVDMETETEIACKILEMNQEKEDKDTNIKLSRALGTRVFTLADLDLTQSSAEDIEAVQQLQQVYQGGQLHYVDSSGDHGYANGSGAQTYQYTDGSQIYSNSHSSNNTTNALFYDTSGTSQQPTMVSSLQTHHGHLTAGSGHPSVGQIVSAPNGNAYIIRTPGGAAGGDSILAMPLSHNTRASPATVSHFRREPKTVQWLIEHFENSEGVSLPRALMYHHYLLHCREQSLDPVNAASFGKLVRSVFMGLRTRRLGTRGNSKYHYYGIRIKASSPLNRMQDEVAYAAMRHPGTNAKRAKITNTQEKMETTDSSTASPTTNQKDQLTHFQTFLGDISQAIPDLDLIQFDDRSDPVPDGITSDDISALEDLYRDHCSNIVDIIFNLQFSLVEEAWQTFWRSNKPTEPGLLLTDDYEVKLSHSKLLKLCNWAPVQRWIKDCDHLMYQSLVDLLIPEVLRPIPSGLTQAIRNFAKGLETTLSTALTGGLIPEAAIKIKTTAVSAFSQTLRRYTSLNHLAQAARAVLQNGTQINQMLSDLNRVDFTNVQEQASWVCQCDANIVKRLETEFKTALSEQRSLEQWAEWLESVVADMLKPHEDTPRFTKAARQFLLKWCFYSSMVIRDLTLRSAASFGSFHLIRLLYDEYMFYLVEHRVANSTGDTPIAVMSDFADLAQGEMGGYSREDRNSDDILPKKEENILLDRFIPKASPS